MVRTPAHRRALNLYIDDEVIIKAREMGLNLSKVAENCLRKAVEALKSIDFQNGDFTGKPGRLGDKDGGLWTLRREFESPPGYH